MLGVSLGGTPAGGAEGFMRGILTKVGGGLRVAANPEAPVARVPRNAALMIVDYGG